MPDSAPDDPDPIDHFFPTRTLHSPAVPPPPEPAVDPSVPTDPSVPIDAGGPGISLPLSAPSPAVAGATVTFFGGGELPIADEEVTASDEPVEQQRTLTLSRLPLPSTEQGLTLTRPDGRSPDPDVTLVKPVGQAPFVAPEVGGAIQGFEIESEIGRGGMGIVYKAKDVRLNRTVALKMVKAGSGTGSEAEDRDRFLDEARAVARLQHPNIVQVFEVGEVNGVPFCALEYVPGGTLAGALKGEPQEPPTAAARTLVLARAMHAVHSAGLIHRDLKPANILLGVDGTLKITDFGLAKRLGSPSGRTLAGQVMGTPCYMAPEQAVGDTARIGTPSDVWALGVILYEMLTGRPPFKGPEVWSTLALVLTGDPVPVRRLQPGCPRDLETVCLKCLEKDPLRRYPSAEALADDLARFLDGRPVLARRAGPVERLVKWARRSPLRAALAATAAACLGMFVAVLVLQARTAQQEADLAQRDATLARQDADLAQRKLDEVRRHEGDRDRFAKVVAEAEKQAATARTTAEWEGVAKTLRAALERTEAEPEVYAVGDRVTSAKDLLGRVETALTKTRRQDAWQKKVADLGDRRGDAVFHITLATGLGRDESLARVRKVTAEGLALFGVTTEGNGPPTVERDVATEEESKLVTEGCYELLLLDAEALARPVPGETAGALRNRVREALTRLDRADRLLSGTRTKSGLARRAEYEAALGRDAEATAAKQAAEATPPALAADFFLLGLELQREEQFGPAIAKLVAALRIEPGHFGAQYLLAVCQLRQGQFQEAKVNLTRCLEQRKEFVWPRLLRASAEMELARRKLGSYADAREDLDAVLAKPPDEDARYVALTNRGVLAIHLRDWDAAVADLSEAVKQKPDEVSASVSLALAHRLRAEHPPWHGDLLGLAPLPAGALDLCAARVAHRARALAAGIATLDAAIERRPKESRLYHERAQLHLLCGNSAPAQTDLARAILLAPNAGSLSTLADDFLALGQLLHDKGDYAGAAQAYGFVLDPKAGFGGERRALAARQRADSFIALRNWKEAIGALDTYLALTPAPDGQRLPPKQARAIADALKARGLIHAGQKDLRAAVDDYTRALGLVRDPEVLALRGWVYLATGAATLAEQDFEEGLRLRPSDADALLGRADARVKLGQVAKAVADAQEAVRRIPNVSDRKARARLRCNAARVFAQGVTLDPDPRSAVARVAEQLKAALADIPREDRDAFWKERVLADPTLARLSGSAAVEAVANAAEVRSR